MPNILQQYSGQYYEDIDRAAQAGAVRFFSPSHPYGNNDRNSHLPLRSDTPSKNLGALEKQNSRFLDPEIKEIIRTLWQELKKKHFRWPRAMQVLVSGAGAGVGVSEISRMSEEEDMDVKIDTLGLSPINPYLRFLDQPTEDTSQSLVKRIAVDLHRIIETHPQDPVVMAIRDETRRLAHRADRDRGYEDLNEHMVSIEALMALQDSLDLRVFETMKKPFIRRQHIGMYPDNINLNGAEYDLIYDQWGVVTHGSKEMPRGKNMLGNLGRYRKERSGVLYVPEVKVGLSPEYFDEIERDFHIGLNAQRHMEGKGEFTLAVKNADMRLALADTFGFDFRARLLGLVRHFEDLEASLKSKK